MRSIQTSMPAFSHSDADFRCSAEWLDQGLWSNSVLRALWPLLVVAFVGCSPTAPASAPGPAETSPGGARGGASEATAASTVTPRMPMTDASTASTSGGPAETVRFDSAGLAITKPAGWYLLEDAMFARTLRKLEGAALEKEIAAKIADGTAFPLVGFTKRPADYPGVNPTVQVRLIPRPSGASALAFLGRALEPTLKKAEDPVITEPPVARTVNGVAGATARYQYTLRLKDGRAPRLETTLWLFPRGDRFLQLTGIASLAEEEPIRREVAAVLEGLELFDPVAGTDANR